GRLRGVGRGHRRGTVAGPGDREPGDPGAPIRPVVRRVVQLRVRVLSGRPEFTGYRVHGGAAEVAGPGRRAELQVHGAALAGLDEHGRLCRRFTRGDARDVCG